MQDSKIQLTISDEKKIEILLKALEERYSATKVIRERVQMSVFGYWDYLLLLQVIS